MSIEQLELIGKEKLHYDSLESLFAYSRGQIFDEVLISENIKETIDDWDKMMGGRSDLKPTAGPFLKEIIVKNRNKARELYLFLSPIFFYIHVLLEMERKSWRFAMTANGIFCERIVRNLVQEIDRIDGTDLWSEMVKDKNFDNRNGRLKKGLQDKGVFDPDTIYSLLKSAYTARNVNGPHDVPPPEPIQADICARQCLPTYVRYLDTLVELGNDFKDDNNKFIQFFYSLTRTNIALIFGKEEIRKTPPDVIKEIYRQGFFSGGKKTSDIKKRLTDLGYTFPDPTLSKTLASLSKGSKAILTKTGKRGSYVFNERYPPEEFFKTTIN